MPNEDANETTAQSALEVYNRVCRELASLYRERGELRATDSAARVGAYEQATVEGANVTTARHAADVAGSHLTTELHKLDGEILASEVELRYLDQLLNFLRVRMGGS